MKCKTLFNLVFVLPLLLAAVILLVTVATASASELYSTPGCGSTITTPGAVVQFDSDMICPQGFTGTALTVAADNVTVNGMGQYAIVAPDAAVALRIESSTNVILTGINASGTGGGTGIYIFGSSGTVVTSCVVNNRDYGLVMAGADTSNSQIIGNDFSNNERAIQTTYENSPAGDGNSYIDNDLSNSSDWGIMIYGDANPTLSGNDFTALW